MNKLVDKYGAGLRDKMKDPVFFINNISGVGNGNDTLSPFQEHWIRQVHNNKLYCLTAFRSSGKTEGLGINYPIFKAFTQNGWVGIVVSAKESQAKEILQRIKKKIEHNPILSKSIPKDKAVSWSKTEINLSNGSRILAKPYTDSLRSWHVNWVMFDEAGEYRDQDIFESNAYAITQANWQNEGAGICVVGTPKSELDLLHTLRKNREFVSEICSADMKICDLIDSNDTKTLWELRYPKQTLLEKKSQIKNNIKFSREFLCKVLSAGDELFPYGIIEASFDYDKGFYEKPHPEYTYYMGLDFALSGESGADYSAYAIFEKDLDNVIRLVKLERFKGLSYGAQKLRIKQLSDIFKPVRVIADEGTFGKAFVQEMRSQHVPIRGFRFQHKRQELLEVFRSAFDTNFTENRDKDGFYIPKNYDERKFFINYSKEDSLCSNIVDTLINELLGFGIVFKTSGTGDLTGTTKFESVKPHDDLVMACALGYWSCNKQGASNLIVARGSGSTKNFMFNTI